jgi:hypothetical protein
MRLERFINSKPRFRIEITKVWIELRLGKKGFTLYL